MGMTNIDASPALSFLHGRFFYGWFIAVASGLGVACSVAIFVPATLSLLAPHLKAELGWSAQQIFLAPAFATTATILVAPFLGGLVDRLSARWVISVSFVIEALIIASFRYIDSSVALFYARYAALAILASGTTAIAFASVIARWFDRRRGLALGIALAGFGLGGVVWSLLSEALFERFGWREAFFFMAGFIMVFTVPVLFVILRDSPEALGLNADGASTEAAATPKAAVPGMTLRQAIGTTQYWMMAVTFFFVGFAVQSVLLHLAPLLMSQGQSSRVAALAQASMWAVLVFGRVAVGWLMDRFFAPRVALAFMIPPIIGIGMLATGASGYAALAAAMMVGLAAGAEVDVVAYLTSRYFGLKHYGKIYSTYFSIYAIGTGIGPALTAWGVGRFGGYGTILWVLVGALIVAGLLLTRYQHFPNSLPD
jgi:MFS family permease